jgi:beta-N-acetylhexosaminidase
MSTPHLHRTRPRTWRAGAKRSSGQLPAWMVRLGLALGLLVLGVRANLASVTFMAPGGDIRGWSQLPSARCALCHVALPAHVSSSHNQRAWTPATYAGVLLQRLTLDDELGQMQMVQFDGLVPTPDAIQMINAEGAGGMLFFQANIRSASQIRSTNAQLQHIAPIPLLLAVDQEGGYVNRFLDVVGPLPTASSLAHPDAARARGTQDAGYLHDYGFNLNLAPVVDVGTSNPQLYGRTFGTDPTQVGAMAAAYMEGLQQTGQVTAVPKHFPGLGDTTTDPHLGLPVLTRSRADWERIDLAPYRMLLKTEDVRAIMVSHEMLQAVDTRLPTTLSPAVIDGTLRGELGFSGVVITDSLYMGALNAHWSIAEAAVLAIKAGADVVIGPYNPEIVQETKDALRQAIASGVLTRARIDTSVRRILTLKLQMGLLPMPRQQAAQHALAPQGSSATHETAWLPVWARREEARADV